MLLRVDVSDQLKFNEFQWFFFNYLISSKSTYYMFLPW